MKKKIADQILNKVVVDYDDIADEFNDTRKYAWYEFEIYKELLQENDVVLDLGCGNGRLYEALNVKNIDYTGIDVSRELLKKAAKNYPKAKFKKGSFLNLPKFRRKFDKIYCVASFHHIPGTAYRKEALLNMKKILKKDGTIIISVWNLWKKKYRKHIWKSLLNLHKYDFGDTFIPWGKSGINRYYHAFSLFEMRSLLESTGFYVVEELMVKKNAIIENALDAENFIFIIKSK